MLFSNRGSLLAFLMISLSVIFMFACGEDTAPTAEFPNKITAPHFVNSYPNHEDVLVQAPEVVVLNFNSNSTLHPPSTITVTHDSDPINLGTASVSDNPLSMKALFEEQPGAGVYHVEYTACWPDGSCHEGGFGFMVDAESINDYIDLRGQSAVTIHMKEGERFDPSQIIISPGTMVTWINDVPTTHFVNSDPHPSHNVIEGPQLRSTSRW